MANALSLGKKRLGIVVLASRARFCVCALAGLKMRASRGRSHLVFKLPGVMVPLWL